MPALGDYVYVYWTVGTQYGQVGTTTGHEYTTALAAVVAAGYGTFVPRPTNWTGTPLEAANPNRPPTRAEADQLYAPAGGIPKVRLRELWMPYSPVVYPESDVLFDGYEDSGPATARFTTGYYALPWNSPHLNIDGMVWDPVDPANPAGGARNRPSARTFLGANTDFEFLCNDTCISFMFGAFDQFDSQIYVSDENDVMHPIRPRPLIYTGPSTFKFRTVQFKTRRTRRIRVTLAFDVYYQLIYSSSGIIRRSPTRPLVVSVSDSFREGTGMKNIGSAESYHTAAISDLYIERTGWSMARLGQGGTGWFNNAAGIASDLGGPDNSRPFFSDVNVARIKAFGKNKIRIIDINGTINDGELSGGKAGMKARMMQGLDKVSTWDPGIRFVIWGPEPYNDTAVDGSTHDLNRQAMIEVAAERADVIGFIDVGNPAAPFYTGMGSEKQPRNHSLQTVLTGFDEIHYNYLGGQHYGTMGMDVMGDFLIEPQRKMY